MSLSADFLATDLNEAYQYLMSCRSAVPSLRGPTGASYRIVVLAVMDGAPAHKLAHPGRHFHYLGFTNECRRVLSDRGGIVLAPELDGKVDYLACAWFDNAARAVVAASAVHESLYQERDLYRPVWVHEKHAIMSVAGNEFAAVRLLRAGRRDLTVIDPAVWERLSPDFRDLAATRQMGPSDFTDAVRKLERLVDENVDAMLERYDAATTAELAAT